MQTLLEVRTKADHMTLPGGIAVRHSESRGEFIVHNFNTDRETGTTRAYWQGSYCSKLSDALKEFARRVERAESYDLGGALALGEFEPTQPPADSDA